MAKILIVDDEPEVCDAMGRLFGQLGWRVTGLTDPAAVLAEVRSGRPDVVLLDVTMPGLDGFAVLQTIRMDPDLARTPVVMYSALGDEDTVDKALAAGADDYIVKGTPIAQIRDRVSLYVPLQRGRDGRHAEGGHN